MDEMFNTVTDGFETTKSNVFNFFNGDRITTRKKLMSFGAIVFMLGIIIGFVFSPIKKGFYFNISNNGNVNTDEDEENTDNKKNKNKRNNEKKEK